MRDIDELIDRAVDEEERELLRSIGEEPGFFGQVFRIFRGPTGWVWVVMMIVQAVLFLAGAWAGWHFFEATDALSAVRWGLPATVLLISALTIKLSMVPTMETNRLLRELKRVEWQLARTRDGHA